MKKYSNIYNIPKELTENKGYIEHDFIISNKIRNINENKKIIKYIQANFPKIKRGDVIHLDGCSTYRNSGKLLWDGTQMVNLDYESGDDYGQVPNNFIIEDFPNKKFFTKSIDHNYVIHIDGRSYEIIKRYKENYGYVHLILHKNYEIHWCILSNNDKKEFQKELECGMFSCNVCNIECIINYGDKYLLESLW